MEKYLTVLKKELSRNLKKTAILGLVCLVALYFWAPLLWSWFGGGKKVPPDAAAAPKSPPAATVTKPGPTTTTTAPKQPAKELSWTVIVEQFDQEALRKSLRYDPAVGNPFFAAAPPQDKQKQPPKEKVKPKPIAVPSAPLDLAKLGIRLEGTVVGRQSRIATINGKTFPLDSELTVVRSDQAQPNGAELNGVPPNGVVKPATSKTVRLSFTVAEIHPRMVILERAGQRFALYMNEPKLADGKDIFTTTAGTSQP